MGFKFDEKTLINNNIFKYEEKLNTQYTRFLDRTPTYVTYYNISDPESTLDLGFSNVEEKIGESSPLRYSEVKNLPVYGIDQIQFNVSEQDEGFDIDFDGELIIMPDTIIPHQDDFFVIEHHGRDLLFQVISVEFDTIKSNNFYKCNFTIKYIDREDTEKIMRQVTEKFTCVVDNIGTDDKCIIKDDELALIRKLQEMYSLLAEKYVSIYYSRKYNCFVYVDVNGRTIYDRYINRFIQKHELIYDPDTHKCIYLSNEDRSCDYDLEYNSSIYKAYEMRKPKRFKNVKFRTQNIDDLFSIFAYYGAHKCCQSVRFANGIMDYLDPNLVHGVQTGVKEIEEDYEDDAPIIYLKEFIPKETAINKGSFDELDLIIINYMNDNIDSVHNIDLEALEELIAFDLSINWNTFIKIPLAMYAIKGYYKLFLQKQLNN